MQIEGIEQTHLTTYRNNKLYDKVHYEITQDDMQYVQLDKNVLRFKHNSVKLVEKHILNVKTILNSNNKMVDENQLDLYPKSTSFVPDQDEVPEKITTGLVNNHPD
jgi:hypothetical protein